MPSRTRRRSSPATSCRARVMTWPIRRGGVFCGYPAAGSGHRGGAGFQPALAIGPGPVFGDPRLVPYRLGRQSFKAVVLDSYHRRRTISGSHIPPVLQAAHIRPVAGGGEHRLDNGLLLRSDVHTLFDCGYLGVDPQHRLLVSPRLRADFSNDDQFYAKEGQVIDLPERRADRPGREFLEWHFDEVFLGAAAT